MNNLFGLATFPSVKRRVFVSYHHANDQFFYNEFSRIFASTYEAIQDRSLDRIIDSENPEYVMRRIREQRIKGSSCTVVLCGPNSSERKYIDWEIKATLDKQHGLIGIHLPNIPPMLLGGVDMPERLRDNLSSGYASWTTWQHLVNGGPLYLSHLVETANSRPSFFISNWRPMKTRDDQYPWVAQRA